MTYINAEEWQPSPGIRIGETALDIVKSGMSVSVMAGPGAGKTELLAQRATFLLTTALCPPPRRILAIAFKVDAARNLSDRVSKRCGSTQSRRFESLTLDAFAKRIVDQFLEGLPLQWRPSPNYRIMFPNQDTWEQFRSSNADECPQVRNKEDWQLNELVRKGIPDFDPDDVVTANQKIQLLWWQQQIGASPSRLTFDMIKSMATCILRRQPSILSALRHTYSHVFLDEFQDVTGLQYRLVQAAFLGSSAILTAVGDTNQAIMRWAGAKRDIFTQFDEDFGASREHLLFNFRSNSRIVELINALAATIDDDCVLTECARQDDAIPENAVQGWVFSTRKAEGEYLASFIAGELQSNEDLKPSDFVILTKILANNVEARIEKVFGEKGLKLRNEARSVGGIAIQDLVKDKAYSFFLASVKLAVNVRDGRPFQDCRNTIADVRGLDLSSDKGHGDSLKAVRLLIGELAEMLDGRIPSEVTGRQVTDLILNHVEHRELKRAYREYIGGERLDSAISGFETLLDECSRTAASWSECISDMEGVNSVRLMTIHKSKGLEYHTVFFVEFNDNAFWGKEGEINVFFVALSRARERVYFSFCKDSKGWNNIRPMIKQLKSANVSFGRPSRDNS